MLLTIRTLSCPPPDDPQSIRAEFDTAGGRIGRSPPCKLILPDPNRHISREHAEIRFRDGAFSIKVVSKVNSVLVNDEVVNPGEAVALHDGDHVLIGEYLLRANVAAAAQMAGFLHPPAPHAVPSGNPFDMFDSPAPVAAPPPWFEPPPTEPVPQTSDRDRAALDELFKPQESGHFGDLLQNASPGITPTKAPPPAEAPVDRRLDEFLGLDPGAALDPATDPLRHRAPPGAHYHGSPLDRPIGPAQPVAPEPPPASAPPPFDDDIFSVLEREFGTPAPSGAAAPAGAEMPPAWPTAPAVSVPPRREVPSPAPASSIDVPPDGSFAAAFDDFLATPVQPPGAPDLTGERPRASVPSTGPLPTAAHVPAPAPEVASARPSPGAMSPQPVSVPEALTAPAPTPVSTPAAVPMAVPTARVADAGVQQATDMRVDGAVSTQRLMAVLAEALELAPEDLDQRNPEETMRLVGQLLRMSTDGLFRMLEMRSQLKSELHIEDRTMIASRENNPLKHADSAHDAIAYLVDLRQHGNRLFMPPAKAVEDTIWDICAHEMAVMAGTRAALLAALRMFSPEVIEGRIKKTGALENVLPALHKSRLWERFLGMYAELQHEAEDHFDRLLNQEFSKAYSEQSKKLKKKR